MAKFGLFNFFELGNPELYCVCLTYKRLVQAQGQGVLKVFIIQKSELNENSQVAFSKKLLWLAQTNVITMKKQMHTVNSRSKRVWQRA